MDMTLNQIIILAAIGVVAGFVSGSMGVGGGVIIIPALVFFLGITQHEAQGTTSTVLSIPVALVAAVNYYKSGYVNFKFAFIIILTFVIGGYLGSKFAVSVPEKVLKPIFGGLLLLVGIKMILGK